jgi:uncharacterized protein YjbI with pentapeptide repeats
MRMKGLVAFNVAAICSGRSTSIPAVSCAQIAVVPRPRGDGEINRLQTSRLHRWQPSLRGVAIGSTRPSGADLEGASLNSAQLDRASFEQAHLETASLNAAQLKETRLDNAQLQRALLNDADLKGALLDGARLDGASLKRAQLQGASLLQTHLEGASLFGARLQGALLDGASLYGASLNVARFQGASVQGASLMGASLDGADFDGASLLGAWLQGASLDGTAFGGASLAVAQLQGASLQQAILVATDLTGAYLWRTNRVDGRDPSYVKLVGVKGSNIWLPHWEDDQYVGQPWDEDVYEGLRETMETLVPGTLRDEALERIERLDCANPDTTLATGDPPWAWVPPLNPPPKAADWRNELERASEDGDGYNQKLEETLRWVLCSDDADAIYVLRGLLHVSPAPSRIEATGREAVRLVDFIMSKDCPVSDSLTAEDKANLLRIKQDALKKPGG